MHPFTPRLTKTQIKFLIAGIHLLSLSVIVPYVVFLKLEDNMCIEQWPKLWYRQVYTLVLFMTQYALPLFFMTTVYALALIKLYNVTSNASSMRVKEENTSSRRSREVSVNPRGVSANSRDVSDNSRKISESLRTSSENSRQVSINSREASANSYKVAVSSRKSSVISRKVSNSSQLSCETSNDLFRNGNRIRRLSSRVAYNVKQGCEIDSNVRVTKLFIAIVAIFAIFMLPNQVLWLWIDFGAGLRHERLNIVKIICWLFTYTNCVCNPVIFITFFKDFRSEVVALPKRLWKRPSSRLSVSRWSSHESENTSPASPVNILSTLKENESCMV